MAQGIDLARLGGEPLARFPVADERIVDLAEGVLDGALVGHEELLLLRLGLLDRALDGARGEDGTDQAARELPGVGGTHEEIGKLHARKTEEARERDPRIVQGPRRPDAGVGGDEVLLRLAQIRSARE